MKFFYLKNSFFYYIYLISNGCDKLNKQNIQNKQLFIIDGQLIGCILYILSLVISITIILDQREKALGREGFLTSEEAQNISLLNKLLILGLVLWFLYLNYRAKELAASTNQETDTLGLQIAASAISLIPALIGLYVVATSFSDSNLQTAEIENPYI